MWWWNSEGRINFTPRKSKIAQDWRQTRNVDPVKVIQKLAQKFGAIWVVIKSSDCFTRTNWLLIFPLGTPLDDWWLGFCAPNAGGPGLILDPGTKILHATKHSQKKKKNPSPNSYCELSRCQKLSKPEKAELPGVRIAEARSQKWE